MEIRNDHNWKEDIPAFREKTAAFYAGELSKDAYKGFSGLYGSYAQKGGKASMLRLRMTGGCVTKEKLKFIADTIRTYNLKKLILPPARQSSFMIWTAALWWILWSRLWMWGSSLWAEAEISRAMSPAAHFPAWRRTNTLTCSHGQRQQVSI